MKEHKLLLILILLFLISELIVNPLGNFPLNDDWSYSKSVLFLHKDGKLTLGLFPSMTLVSHLIWGALFTKIFGFSFTVLRFSTLISSLIGIIMLNKLAAFVSGSKVTAFILSLALLFNPIYFNLSNTYMTDINFNTLLIITCYFSFAFFRRQSALSFALVFIFSIVLVLIRQFGIILPLSFTFACLFLNRRRWLYTGMAALAFVLIIFVFSYYENYLKTTLNAGSAYKFSNDIHITEGDFWEYAWFIFKARYKTMLLHVLLYTLPFLIIFAWRQLRDFKTITNVLVCISSIALVVFLFKDERFLFGNIFINTALGAETFFETLYSNSRSLHEHTYSEAAEQIAMAVKYGFTLVTLICCVLWLFKLIRLRVNPLRYPFVIFLASLFFMYVGMMLVSKSYFDRYNLPLITVALLLFSFIGRYYQPNYRLAILPLVFLFYISVCGTRDYLELNRTRWQAYDFLKTHFHADYTRIDGGFEINSWNEGASYSNDLYTLENCDYLIQYRPEKNFRMLREYKFRRYFPFKEDRIYIFMRTRKSDLE